MFDVNDKMQCNEVTLMKTQIAIQDSLSSHDIYIHNLSLKAMRNQLTDNMTFRLIGFILSEDFDPIVREVEYPADWWNAFKEQWFPEFVLKKYPAKMKRVELKVTPRKIYPKLKVSLPKEQSYLKMIVEERENLYWKE